MARPRRGRPPSTTSCHNCHKNRLRCDRSRPACNKCTAKGETCMGYDRLFLWAPCDPREKEKEKEKERDKVRGGRVKKKTGEKVAPVEAEWTEKNGDSSKATCERDPPPDSRIDNPETETQALVKAVLEKEYPHLSDPPPNVCLDLALRRTYHEQNPSPGRYLDPIFQDFSERAKMYLNHFQRVTRDIVAHDHFSANPFRDIVPLALNQPVLLNIVLASSAMHIANLYHGNTIELSDGDISQKFLGKRERLIVSKRAVTDALEAKARAYAGLRGLMADMNQEKMELAIMAMYFFINIELIDVEKSDWKAHLQGVGTLLQGLEHMDGAWKEVFDNIIAHIVIYNILGSTLMSKQSCITVGTHILPLMPALHRTQADIYICCPSFLLEMILSASILTESTASLPNELLLARGLEVFHKSRNFDLDQWVAGMPSVQVFHDRESRIRVAACHRAAVCLYVMRAVPAVEEAVDITADELREEIMGYMASVDEKNVHFKGAAWPLFMAGGECIDPESREWVMQRLMLLWKIVPWGYILTAIQALRDTWAWRDAQSESELAKGQNWLQALWKRNSDWLIV